MFLSQQLHRLYNWTLSLSAHRHAVWLLAFIAFIESSFFPLPPDILLIPMILAARERAWFYAGICTLASVLGGYLGYAIGFGLYETIGAPIVAFYGYHEQFANFQNAYHEWGAWIVAMAGVTPFPYKIITIASGVVSLDIFTFSIASLLSRGARFFLVAALLWWLGPAIKKFIEKYLGLLTILFFILLFGGFLAVKYLF